MHVQAIAIDGLGEDMDGRVVQVALFNHFLTVGHILYNFIAFLLGSGPGHEKGSTALKDESGDRDLANLVRWRKLRTNIWQGTICNEYWTIQVAEMVGNGHGNTLAIKQIFLPFWAKILAVVDVIYAVDDIPQVQALRGQQNVGIDLI